MHERIKQIRIIHKLTQKEFAEKLGLSENYVILLERGKRKPSDRTIRDICKFFNINEDWLRNGTEPMFNPSTKKEEVVKWFAQIVDGEPDSIQLRFIEAISKLDIQDWKHIAEIEKKMLGK